MQLRLFEFIGGPVVLAGGVSKPEDCAQTSEDSMPKPFIGRSYAVAGNPLENARDSPADELCTRPDF